MPFSICCFVGWVFSYSYILSLILEIQNIFDHDGEQHRLQFNISTAVGSEKIAPAVVLGLCCLVGLPSNIAVIISIAREQCWAVTSYCNLVTVIILLFALTSSVTNY